MGDPPPLPTYKYRIEESSCRHAWVWSFFPSLSRVGSVESERPGRPSVYLRREEFSDWNTWVNAWASPAQKRLSVTPELHRLLQTSLCLLPPPTLPPPRQYFCLQITTKRSWRLKICTFWRASVMCHFTECLQTVLTSGVFWRNGSCL